MDLNAEIEAVAHAVATRCFDRMYDDFLDSQDDLTPLAQMILNITDHQMKTDDAREQVLELVEVKFMQALVALITAEA